MKFVMFLSFFKDTAIPHLCGKSLMAVRGFLKNCPPNFASLMKGSVDPVPRTPLHVIHFIIFFKVSSIERLEIQKFSQGLCVFCFCIFFDS
jgi:hypothetical protein